MASSSSRPIYEIDGDEVSFQGYGKVKGKQVSNMGKNTYVGDIAKANYNNQGAKDTPKAPVNNTPTAPEETYYEPEFDWAAYYAQLQAEAQARANAAYERNMERIANAYGNASSSLKSNYDSTVGRLNAARDKSLGDVRGDAEDSLRQAYINNMMTRKNLNQRLSAMGMNGGATETTMSSLENQYGKSRAGINETLNKNIANLDSTYGDNLAAALQSFNSAKANLDLQRMQLEMQAENARQNAEASSMSGAMNIDSGYISALKAALANQGQYKYDPSQATNDYIAGNAQQAQSASQGGNSYAMWMAQQLLNSGATPNEANNFMLTQGYTKQTIQDILRQLGITA